MKKNDTNTIKEKFANGFIDLSLMPNNEMDILINFLKIEICKYYKELKK